MKFEIKVSGIRITPETDQDRAYIQDTLGLKKNGDTIELCRKDYYSCSQTAYLETTKRLQPTAKSAADPTEPYCGPVFVTAARKECGG